MEQRLVQSPQMIQAMQILQLSALDLQERIDVELAENPFLEVAEENTPEDGAPGKTDEAASGPEAEAKATEADGVEQMLDEMERWDRDFGDGRGSQNSPGASGESGDKKYEAMQNTPNEPETLAEALLEQTAILELDERQRTIVEFLVFSLDERGYLCDTFDNIAFLLSNELDPPVTDVEIYSVLMRLRKVTHPGIGAQDLSDCLLLQLDARGMDQPLVQALAERHLDDLEANRLPRVAKATGASMDELKQAIEILRTLDPNPGAQYGSSRNSAIHPDVVVEEEDGAYRVRLEREGSRDLTLSPLYRKMLDQAKGDETVRKWVKQRLESARWFIDAVAQRQSTLLRISEALFARQRDFLEHGVSALKPLRMQEIADEVHVHISTVSRGVAGKYAQTPRGIFALKFFFTGGMETEGGGVESQLSIKERIRKIIAAEDRQKPLSDDLIARQMGDEEGVKIARRTVTKYRKALGLPSSSKRREY